MQPTKAYAVKSPTSTFEPFSFTPRELRPRDVLIKILYCGICHSDIHKARDEWSNSQFPMVPGHEIVGKVSAVGSAVKNFTTDMLVGVGVFVDSCRNCDPCQDKEEHFCQKITFTYDSMEQDGTGPTYGGYASQIVVDEKYVLKLSPKLSLAHAAPLLCAGITTYSPLKRFGVKAGHKVAVAGLGGLGHMAVKFAVSMGAEVTVLSTSPNKEQDAYKLGAHKFAVTKDPAQMAALQNHFDFILNTIAAPHDINLYLDLLGRKGTLALVALPEKPLEIAPFSLIAKSRELTGSFIGSIAETQEMLDYCAEKGIASEIEMIPIQKVDEAFNRVVKGDVRYRFVIDMGTL